MTTKEYMRQYMKERAAKRKEAGLCIVCGKTSDGMAKCQPCRATDNRRQKERQDRLAAQGLCKMCGKSEAINGHLYCDQCLRKANKSTRKHAAKRKNEGRCHSCGKDSGGKLRCKECNDKGNAALSQMRKHRVENGLCRDCGEQAITTTRNLRGRDRAGYCCDCYLKMMSRTLLGSGTKWKVLLEKLNLADWKCCYTGDVLVVGDNLSFDHLDPVSRFPERKYDSTNIEPCTWQVNLMKRDLTKEEFLAMTEKIARNLKLRVV